jgi:prepilin-type N-terminal cleavage/methylation domain-containing protein
MLIAARARGRTGFTLIELLVAMVFVAIVGTSIVGLMARQGQFHTAIAEMIATRQQIRRGVAMLPSELRGLSISSSTRDNDIYAMTDSSIDFRSTYGSSFVCVNNAGNFITTVPARLVKGSVLTNWAAEPAVNDSVAIYNDSVSVYDTDDYWDFHQVAVVTKVTGNVNTGCPSSSGLVQSGDLTGNNPSYQLKLATPTQTNKIKAGAAIRFFRKVHYSIYKAADKRWYLGYYDCLPNRVPVCAAIEPIAGPLQPYAPYVANDTSGARFTYYDATGAVTTNVKAVARVSIVFRAAGQSPVSLVGTGTPGTFKDSLRVDVAIRNR